MRNLLIFLLLAFSSAGAVGSTDQHATPADCAADQAHVRVELDRVHRDYRSMGSSPAAAKLVALDARLRKLVGNRLMCSHEDTALEKASDAAIGISVEHYSVMFWYSGKLLAKAHRINPNSPLRSRTLYSTVEQYSASSTSWDLPDFQAAKAYLREFPDGPFADDAALILAGAYKDAYWGLHLDQSRMDIDSYACVADRLGDLKDKPRAAQAVYAKKMADRYFRQVFSRRAPNEHERYWYDSWREGHPTYDYCPD